MQKFRPYISLVAVALATLVLAAIYRYMVASLGRYDWMTGYTLAAICTLMVLLPIRRKLILLSMRRVAAWQQVHHFMGLFGVVVYIFHAGILVNGYLEATLAMLFLVLSFSGIGHWYFNRRIPILLRSAGEPIRLQDVSKHRNEIAKEAYAVALSAATNSKSACLAEFYTRHLSSYFKTTRSIAYYLRPSGKVRRYMQSQLDGLGRYLSDDSHHAAMKMFELVKRRDDVDFQAAMMMRIRAWNLVHVAITWSFIAVASLHVFAVFRFSGS